MIEVRTVRITWFVETGYCDAGGVGYWDGTKESVPCDTEDEANSLRDQWLSDGKLEKMYWGELRPKFMMGLFRIRSHEDVVSVQQADQP